MVAVTAESHERIVGFLYFNNKKKAQPWIRANLSKHLLQWDSAGSIGTVLFIILFHWDFFLLLGSVVCLFFVTQSGTQWLPGALIHLYIVYGWAPALLNFPRFGKKQMQCHRFQISCTSSPYPPINTYIAQFWKWEQNSHIMVMICDCSDKGCKTSGRWNNGKSAARAHGGNLHAQIRWQSVVCVRECQQKHVESVCVCFTGTICKCT